MGFAYLLIFIIPAILFLVAQQNTLRAIQSHNREMAPGLIWLQCIPVFGFIWQFIVVAKISGSISKELSSRGEESIFGLPPAEMLAASNKRPTLLVGIAYCLILTAGLMINFFSFSMTDRMINAILLFDSAGIICWIVYWVKLARYKRILRQNYL